MHQKKLLIQTLILALILVILAVAPAYADDGAQAALKAAQTELAVGDPVQLTLEVTHPAGTQAIIPKLEQTWGPYEVRGQSPVSVVTNPDGTQTTSQIITVTLFDLGAFETPALPITLNNGQGQTSEITAAPVSLTVNPTRPEGDTALRDIRPQAELEVPVNWALWLGGLLAAVAVVAGGWWFYRRWQGRALRAMDNRLPYQVAYDELGRIEALHLPEQKRFKEHYSLITDCLRAYLEQQLQVSAFDRTTSELKLALRQSTVATEPARQLVDLFSDSDLVKFAKVVPDVAEAYQVLAQAGLFVDQTKPIPAAASPKPEVPLGGGQPRKPAEVLS